MNENRASQHLHNGADETIESIVELERRALERVSQHQRLIERMTASIGRPRTVYLSLTFVFTWIALNLLLLPSGRVFDAPPFFFLQGIIAFGAFAMTILILTTETQTYERDVLRDRLQLQINLLNDRKISKVIEMLQALRRDSPNVPNRADPEATELREIADPHAISRAIDDRIPE